MVDLKGDPVLGDPLSHPLLLGLRIPQRCTGETSVTISPVKFLLKFTNTIGEITGESPVKLLHRPLVLR